MALTVSGASTPKSISADAYRSIMLGAAPASLTKKAAAPANMPPSVAAPAPAAKPTVQPLPAPTATPRPPIAATSGPANQPPPAAAPPAPVAKPAPVAAGPANQPPPAPAPKPVATIDNSQGGAGTGQLPGKPIVPPTGTGVPPNMPKEAVGGGTVGGNAFSGGTNTTYTPPPPVQGVKKAVVSPLPEAKAYPTFNPNAVAGYNPNAYAAPKPVASYSTQPANQPQASYAPIRMNTTPGAAYPTVTPGQSSVALRDTGFSAKGYPSAQEFAYQEQALRSGTAARQMALPASMPYRMQAPANQPLPPPVGAGNRISTIPPQAYGGAPLSPAGTQLPQPSFRSYPGQPLPTPPPIGGYNPGAGREIERSQGAGTSSQYDPGAGRQMEEMQGQAPPPAQSPYNEFGRMVPVPPAPTNPWANDPYNRGGGGYNPNAGERMAQAQGQGRGPSYQEIMARQQTPFLPRASMSPQQYMQMMQGGGASMPFFSPQQMMAIRQGGGGY